MKLAIISDTHGHTPDIEPVDLALICGDVCPVFDHEPTFQRSWLETNFAHWLESLDADRVIGIAGNHDFIFQTHRMAIANMNLRWTYLEDSGTTYDELYIYGTPWIPNLPNWAFHASEARMEDIFSEIPDNTDILITHGPARNVLDKTCERFGLEHAGSNALLNRLRELPNLGLHAFGHIHEARNRVDFGQTIHINASYVDENYLTYPKGVVYLDL